MDTLKKNHTLTFYRKMANTNSTIMKKYKSAVINGMTFKQLLKIYTDNNIKFEEDIERLIQFKKEVKEEVIENHMINKTSIKFITYNPYNFILQKYPYISKNSIIYTVLTNNINSKKSNQMILIDKYYTQLKNIISIIKSYLMKNLDKIKLIYKLRNNH